MKRIFLFCLISILTASPALAVNIDPQDEGNDFAILQHDNSQISFDCTNCNVEVTSADITGYAWSATAGWINLQPASSGVVNDGDGNLSGFAWGQNTGWVNFNPTFGGVEISNGQFNGYAWSQNYGWIQFDCAEPGACVETSWVPAPPDTPSGGGGGSGVSTNPDTVFGCTSNEAENYNPLATVNDGSCVFNVVVLGCTVPGAVNFNPQALVDDNSCQFGEVEIPTEPPSEEDIPFDVVPDDNTPNNPADQDSLFGGDGETPFENIEFPYTVTREVVGQTLGLASLILLGLSLLSIPFQQLLQAPARAIQLLLSWFGIGTKKNWGTVFDSMTKHPLDPVVVVLKDMQGKVVQTSITDMEGRYGFIAPPGLYSLEANKADYIFPSEKLKGMITDGLYEDIYTGGTFQILEQGEIVTKNIPLDPVHFNWNEFEKAKMGIGIGTVRKQKIRKYSKGIFIGGFAFSIIALFFAPIIWNYVILGLYIVAGTLQALGLPRRSGVVTHKGQTLSFGVMRVFSNTLKKEMKKVVLDQYGNYYCLIKNGEYYVTLEQRNQDGSYTLIHTSEPFQVKGGAIKKHFNI